MSRRNFILLIIVLGAGLVAVFGFWYFSATPSDNTGETPGTNFISRFNPFGKARPNLQLPRRQLTFRVPTPKQEKFKMPN